MTILTTEETWTRERKPHTFELTAAEKANVRRALIAMRAKLGSWQVLADRIGCHRNTVKRVVRGGVGKGKHPTVGMALYASRAVGAPVEDILSGAWPPRAQLTPGKS